MRGSRDVITPQSGKTHFEESLKNQRERSRRKKNSYSERITCYLCHIPSSKSSNTDPNLTAMKKEILLLLL